MDLQDFKKFCKQESDIDISPNCVIYGRVSSKEQEYNYSLTTQRDNCEGLARLRKLTIQGYFGGKYESAKNDERKEFNRMLDFIKTARPKISYIIVNDASRFSRSGANAIYIASQLRKNGVKILTVKNPVDTGNAMGEFHQNMEFLFAQWDNTGRREKTVDGMRAAMKDGKLCTAAPFGYTVETVNGVQQVKVNENARYVKLAFKLKAQGVVNTDIVKKLKLHGHRGAYKQQLTRILSNPFYCGVIVHSLLDEPIQGKHEPIIDTDLFMLVNGIGRKGKGHVKIYDNENLPLKGFLKCAYCDTPYTGFKAKKNGKYYYRCNKTGCKCNISAEKLHESFKEELYNYTLNSIFAGPLTATLRESYKELNEDMEIRHRQLKGELSKVKAKIEQIEERWVLGEVTKELYEKFAGRYLEEQGEIEKELGGVSVKLSNLDIVLGTSMRLVSNMPKVWELSYLDQQRQLQSLVFPDGIRFAKREMNYQTDRTNLLFGTIRNISASYKGEFKRTGQESGDFWEVVPPTGQLSNLFEDLLELARFADTADLTMLEYEEA